jgi:hypothetical protein
MDGQTRAAEGGAMNPVQRGIRPARQPVQNKHSNASTGFPVIPVQKFSIVNHKIAGAPRDLRRYRDWTG